MHENTRTQITFSIVRIKKTFHITTAIAFFLQQLVPYSSAFAMESDETRETSSPFAPTPRGVTRHRIFVGQVHQKVYEIWEQLSERETESLRPLIATEVPVVTAPEKIDFTLGKGNFGATYAGRDIQTRKICAIKEVYSKTYVDESLQEGEIVHSLGDYLHIMPLVDYLYNKPYEKTDPPSLFQVMPLAYINGSGFKEMLARSNAQREKVVADSFYQMMMGLEYIHGKDVIHLDIKADNTLYMKDGTLRIADFGRAKNMGANDQITDPRNGLGDKKKFSPEIVALFRKYMGETVNIVDSFSGKGADVWAAGLYVWELLEDNTDNLFSTQSFRDPLPRDGGDPLRSWAAFYTDERFEELLENISFLKGKFSPSLLNLLRLTLNVDPELRLGSSQIIKKLTSSAMSPDDRRVAFEALIRVYKNPSSAEGRQHLVDQPLPAVNVFTKSYPDSLAPANDNTVQINPFFNLAEPKPASIPVLPPADLPQEMAKSSDQPLLPVFVPAGLNPGDSTQFAEANQSLSDDSLIKARKAEKLKKAKEDLRRREELLAQREADLQKQIAAEEEKKRKKAEKEDLRKQEQLLAQREADLQRQLAAEEQRKKAAEEEKQRQAQLLAQREADLQRQIAAEEEQRRRSIPQIAWGHEDVYERFLKGRLIYKPNKGNDIGRIELRIADLPNPLDGEFDLSDKKKFGDIGKDLSINTGYRKGLRPENASKVEIWFVPHFLIEKNFAGSASHFKGIMGSWDASKAPVGTFFTWGGWDDLNYYEYATKLNWDSYNNTENDLRKIYRVTYSSTRHFTTPITPKAGRATAKRLFQFFSCHFK